MSNLHIGVIVGSLRRNSFNKKLAGALIKLAPADFRLKTLQIDDLPLYNQDDDADQPATARRLKEEIRDVDALIFVTPEYNRSIPGVLKNAIDHASRPYGDSAWKEKPAGILGISPGQQGTMAAQQHLRTILSCLDMPVLCLPEVYLTMRDDLFQPSGAIGPAKKELLQKWMDHYAAWVELHVKALAVA